MTQRNTVMLSDVCDEIYEYWDYEGNDGKDPSDFSCKTHKKVKLYCKKHNIHYERQVDVINSKRGHCYCPKCATDRKYVSGMKNGKRISLIEYIPELSNFWVKDMNEMELEGLTAYSSKTVYLYCKTHDFYFSKRVTSLKPGKVCPICAGKRKPIHIFYPELEKEYSDKNVIPFNCLHTKSDVEIIWRCSHPDCDCEWVAAIHKRVNGHNRCPNENNHKKIKPKNRINEELG